MSRRRLLLVVGVLLLVVGGSYWSTGLRPLTLCPALAWRISADCDEEWGQGTLKNFWDNHMKRLDYKPRYIIHRKTL